MAETFDVDRAIDNFQRGITERKQGMNVKQWKEYLRRLPRMELLFNDLVQERPQVKDGIYEAFDTGRTIVDAWDTTRRVFTQLSHHTYNAEERVGLRKYETFGLLIAAVNPRLEPLVGPIHADVINALPVADFSFSTLDHTVGDLRDLRAYHIGLQVLSEYVAAQGPGQPA